MKTDAKVPGIDDNRFQQIAEGAKKAVRSPSLAGVEITMDAGLIH